MVATSPRVDPRLVAAAFMLDDRRQPYAESCRRVGDLADTLGLPRPSYDTIRLSDVARGLVGPWDLDRILAAASIASTSHRRRAL